MEDNFYLTLHSNTSLHLNENNHSGEFVIHFGHTLHLKGQWEVALVEMHYPMTVKSLHKQASILRKDGQSVTVIRVPDLFVSEEQMIKELNIAMTKDLSFYLGEDYHVEVVQLDATINEDKTYIFPDNLKLQLGFSHDKIFSTEAERSVYPANVKRGLPQKLHVYSNIVKPHNVSGNHEPLLRIVPMETSNYHFGCTHSHIIEHPFYFPVSRQSFDTMEVYIKGDNQDPVSFEYGSSTIVLHLRKII